MTMPTPLPDNADAEHWTIRAARLADSLRQTGDLSSPVWHSAVSAMPRHLLIPIAYTQEPASPGWTEIDTRSRTGQDLVYSTDTLVTAIDQRGPHVIPVSSGTKPDLVVRMLELLDVHDGQRVLEIGTGTGYTAGLLAHRLGDGLVHSVDVDAELVDLARQRLALAGFHPHLVAADGIRGLPSHAPYDRIIATCSVPAVPWAWAEQLAPGGRVLVDIKRAVNAGNLVLLHRHPDRLEGRFTARWAAFMRMRHHADHEEPHTTPTSPDTATSRTTTTPPMPWWDQRIVWFLAQFNLPAGVLHGARLNAVTGQPRAVTLTAPDGSWAEVTLAPNADGSRNLTEAGPTPLWSAIENAHHTWTELGTPDWPRFGLTATQHDQWIWLDDSSNDHRWPLTTATR